MALPGAVPPAKLGGMTPDCSIIVRSPAEAVAFTPYVLGFHPTDSLVVLGLAGKLVVVGVRYDLPPPAAVFDEVAQMIAQQGAPEVVVLGYGPPRLVTSAVLGLVAALAPVGVRVREALRVTDGRWWSYSCSDQTCCPAEGTPCRADLAAEAVYRGMVALPDRKALVAQVAPATGPIRREMAAATERARARFADLTGEDLEAGRGGQLIRKAGRQAVREAERATRAGGMPSHGGIAWLGVLLVRPVVLDYALDRCGPDDWRERLWGEVMRLVEPEFVPGPACLLAFAAWQSGNGALARVAIDRALKQEPAHRMAGMLDRLLGLGIAPHALVELRSPVRASQGRRRPGSDRQARRSTRRRSV
ncbi:hypothetical protein BJ973_007254 [Actinoplanes tereljensis]|uniref:DUF4192 domain-containing protein n=1 Tax=Paractinoplanes tereljensis TaxID=571912 RepID=A0A919TWD4_9ACTN|nr:DUF4192 domain-containing protein [Actinoplanes tereljensis]GIF24996.1 hypothetical protein Ate02nite_77260 [Actinoplanes tereljensis]